MNSTKTVETQELGGKRPVSFERSSSHPVHAVVSRAFQRLESEAALDVQEELRKAAKQQEELCTAKIDEIDSGVQCRRSGRACWSPSGRHRRRSTGSHQVLFLRVHHTTRDSQGD